MTVWPLRPHNHDLTTCWSTSRASDCSVEVRVTRLSKYLPFGWFLTLVNLLKSININSANFWLLVTGKKYVLHKFDKNMPFGQFWAVFGGCEVIFSKTSGHPGGIVQSFETASPHSRRRRQSRILVWSGVDVMITIFAKTSRILSKKRQYFR
jgi:hypothetical protein